MDKRKFLQSLTTAAFTTPFSLQTFEVLGRELATLPISDTSSDDAFWLSMRGGYRLKPDYINLENGYYNILPEVLLEKYVQHIREVNYEGSYYMRTVQFDNKKRMAGLLASLTGCPADELILTRNTTESLDMIIGGYPWNTGDEAVMAEQDYGAMLEMFKQVAKRNGVVNKIISIPNHPQSDEEIVQLYANAITPKTRLLMVCHMINITGQILPIRKICEMAHSKGVEVMVDGAHAIAQIPFAIPDLQCDYYGASLHKWLSVPLGVGMLYVKKQHIQKIWPLLAEGDRPAGDISKLNHLGTHPVHSDLAIADAIEFYKMIGAERKEARLRFLQNYWTSRVTSIPGVILNTPTEANRSCAIANVGIKNMKPALLAETLLKKYKIWTVAIDYANVQGCRITPNIFTTTNELDQLVKALTELSQSA
ncbi:MAG: aminotransferase class V-fold PLP-dependent enzyme [Chitinophagia bacterium]|jgi:selenocysteine lyase/cysteine desulfurase